MSDTGFYALWLMPIGEVYDRLAQVIIELGHKYQAPVFEPHVTLLAGIPGPEELVVGQCHRLAAMVEPYSIQLTKLDQLDEFYRCVFVRVLETAPVMETNLKARDVFGLEQGLPHMPHLSLLYGNFPEATKRQIIHGLEDSCDLKFQAESMHLIDGRGRPPDWHRVREFAFRAPSLS